MITERSLQALLRIWPELPRLVGLQWRLLYRKLHDILCQAETLEASDRRAWLVADLLELLSAHRAAAKRLDEVRAELGVSSGLRHAPGVDPTEPAPVPSWDDLVAGIRERLAPETVTRFTDITAPRRLARGRRGAVTVRLTRSPDALTEASAPLTLHLDREIEVHLVSTSSAVEVLSSGAKTLVVTRGEDTEPLVFFVLATAPGRAELGLAFRQDGLVIASVALEVEVCEADEPEEQRPATGVTLWFGGPYAPSPDIELFIRVERLGGESRLHYTLHSPNGVVPYHSYGFASRPFRGSPETYHHQIFAEVNQLGLGKEGQRYAQALDAAQLTRRLAAIGERIGEELLPAEIQPALASLWASSARTLQITTDEPWIPWEIVRPDLGGDLAESPFCERFELTRWLPGYGPRVGRMQIRHLACVEASHSAIAGAGLSGAVEDCRYLASLASAGGLAMTSLPEAGLSEIEELLDREEVDLWHFSGHGAVESTEGLAVLHLRGRDVLRPTSLDRRRRKSVARNRPLVVMCACHAAHHGWSLTRVSGWAEVWVQGCQCGAFVAPMFSVDDTLAHLFNKTLYEELRSGATVARAVWAARRRVKERSPEDPTWLAFSAYAHPNALVALPPSPDA